MRAIQIIFFCIIVGLVADSDYENERLRPETNIINNFVNNKFHSMH